MIEVIKTDGTNIFYKCSCGALGRCMLKSTIEDTIIITTLTCPLCGKWEQVTLTDEDNLDLEEATFSWSCMINNQLLEKKDD